MKTPRKASPARSQGPVRTPIFHKTRRSLSVTSARSSASVILSDLVQQKDNASFVVSPLGSRKSVLSDNTEIEEPRRKSWWTNLGEHSTMAKDFLDLIDDNKNLEPINIFQELDMEIVSQENKKNHTLQLSESSDSESINSIVIPQRKLFPQKENQKQNYFSKIVGSLVNPNETCVDRTPVTGTRELFQKKQRTRPIFPAALLNISPDKTVADKSNELTIPEPKAQVRNIFGQGNTKLKNIFANFIVTESEDEVSIIQPKVFGFKKTIEASRRSSLRNVREPSPASSITTDMEMDDWKMLPSSTMMENQLEVQMTGQTPKKARLSNLTERESEAGSNALKQSKKSNSSEEDKSRKSKTFTKENACEPETIDMSTTLGDINENQNKSTKDAMKSRKSKTFTKDLETSRITRNKSIVQPDDKVVNQSKTKISKHTSMKTISPSKNTSPNNTSIKTRSQSKNTSPNNSQVIKEVDLKSQTTNNNKTISHSKDNAICENMQQDKPDDEGNNDVELNFSLHYESDHDEVEDIPNKSMNSKSMSGKDISQEIDNDSEEKNESKFAQDEVDYASDNEEDNGKLNESQAAEKNYYESDNEHEKYVEQNEDDNASDNELHDLSLEQNQSESQNENQQVEDDNEENQNETHADSDTERNESQVENESDTEQNESQVQNESDTDQNESQLKNESDTEQKESQVQNESDTELNESQVEKESDTEQNESQVQNESDTEQNESNIQDEIQVVAEENDVEQEEQDSDAENNRDQEVSAVDEIIETPNVSHDTTGRNKSPEAVLHESRNLINSFFSVKGDKTLRKTEMPRSTHRNLVPARESAGFSDGSSSSAQGSGWDSHRTTRKTLRQTYGQDFTPRKSLRALVMEKSAKRQTQRNEMASVTASLFPQANSTEFPSTRFDDEGEDESENRSPNDMSPRTRQTTIEKYLMGVAKKNAEIRQKIEEKVLNSLKEPPTQHIFKIPTTPLFARNATRIAKQSRSATRAAKITKLFGGVPLPQEVLEDLMYKPPKRYQPRNAAWATKHLYKFLEDKLEPKYNYKSRVRAERLMETLYNFTKDLRRRSVACPDAVEVLKLEMARLCIVKTHHEFYEFFGKFMPREVRRKVMPDVVNNIDLPREGVFSDIL